MKEIHIINPYATLDNEGWRKYRTNIVAEKLSKNYKIVLWISNVDHRTKKLRSEDSLSISVNDNYVIKVIKSRQYASNASFDRIFYERDFILKVFQLTRDLSIDCFIFTDPCIFYFDYISKFKKRHYKSKILIDILDLWPEAFLSLLSKRVTPIAKIVLYPFYYLRSRVYKNADAFISVTRDYLMVVGEYLKHRLSEVVYIGIEPLDTSLENTSIKNLPIKNNERWVVYAGTLGVNYDIRTILSAAMLLELSENNYKIIIAGAGPMDKYVNSFIRDNRLTKTIFLGRLNQQELNFLYSKSDALLSTYLANSSVSMPVKAYDSILYQLPIINSLSRELSMLIKEREIGLQYQAESPDDLFEKINHLFEDNNRYNRMCQNLGMMIEEFSIASQYHKYEKLVNQLLNE